jgi:hypothetical protein
MRNRRTAEDFGLFKWPLIGLVLFVVLCHAIRLGAQPVGGLSFTSLTSMSTSGANSATLDSLNGFRKRCGQSVESLARICPQSAEPHCRKALQVVNLVLGID